MQIAFREIMITVFQEKSGRWTVCTGVLANELRKVKHADEVE